jgi:pilus assembly protein Flp/PilA
MRILLRFFSDKSGTTAVEYGLIIGIIGSALVAGAGLYGTNLGNMFGFLSNKVQVQGQVQ